VGVDRWTTMLGARVGMSGMRCDRKESRREEDGGGDLRRGDTGHDGVLSPDAPVAARDRGILDVFSDTVVGWSCGVAAVDSARCMAAAEGILGACPVILGGL
jgi:hypothetical protein